LGDVTILEAGSYLHHRRYRIRQPLGRGGMGAVYLAEDLNLASRLVAVKENLNNSEDAQRQFRREAVLLAHLRHPNLPQVIDYFLDESGRQYLVMEYVPGENMQEALASNGALPMAEALTCMDQVMQAVTYMHRQRDPESGRPRAVIHRDIKPANIKRTPEGRYVLVDFGIAKVQSQTAAATAVSARALTPGYAPIEQYHGGTDERSDIYALGATFYALVTGKAPPSATSMASGAPLPPPRSYNSKIPANVSKVIERAMRMAVQDRYQRVTEMYAALFNRPLPTAPGTIRVAGAAGRRAALPDRATVLAVGGIAVVSVLVFWWLLANSSELPAAAPLADPPAVTRTATPAVLAAAVATPAPAESTPGGAGERTSAQGAIPDATIVAEIAATPTRRPTSSPTPLPAETPLPTATLLVLLPLDDPDATLTAVAATMVAPIATMAVPIATATEGPVATVSVSAAATPTPGARATSTRLPATNTATPAPTATPSRTPQAAATLAATLRPTAVANIGGSGPTSARILAPPDNAASAQSIQFAWEPNGQLGPGQEYEVVFWRPGEDELMGRGWVRSSTATSVVIDPQWTPSGGTYLWAVYLVRTEPYARVRRISEVRSFTASSPSSGGSSGDGGSGGDERP